MDRDQAAEIQKHLLVAADALEEATMAMPRLGPEERKPFEEILFGVQDTLHFGLLGAIHDAYPELKPEDQEPPHISSTLRWDEVSLPGTAFEADIDALIAKVLTTGWQKTAMVIAIAFQQRQERTAAISPEMLGARLVALAESGRIEGAGDLRKWRHSEVRLPHQSFIDRSAS